MTDQWFLQDVEKELATRNRVLVVDPLCECEFLMRIAEDKGIIVLKTNGTKHDVHWKQVYEELQLRFIIETDYADKPVLIYATRPLEELSFLFDYGQTHGLIDFTKSTEWLKQRLFRETGLQVNMESPMLLTAAKLGVGKKIGWWKKILQNLEDLINLEDELLPFLDDPEQFLKGKPTDIRRLFEERLFEILEQPYVSKPPKILAKEVVDQLFHRLLNDTLTDKLKAVYKKWLDSQTYVHTLGDYVHTFTVSDEIEPWKVNPGHCFEKIDFKLLEDVVANIRDKPYLKTIVAYLRERVSHQKSNIFVPSWWSDILVLIDYDSTPLQKCTNLASVTGFYTTQFHHVDRAIRNLYAAFLQEDKIVRPLQEYYESLNRELLDIWFQYAGSYANTQFGGLINIIQNAAPQTAVIVCDGLRWEIADHVRVKLQGKLEIQSSYMLADIPSETEHNMSGLYTGLPTVLARHSDREKKLLEITGKNISFMSLEQVHSGVDAEYLVLTYKDIDSAGEKLQQGAIKLFAEFERVLEEKILDLVNIGYKKVHVVTDHGFVLTGLLSESDKVQVTITGDKEVKERYIRTVEKQSDTNLIGFQKNYGDYRYVYVSKTQRPFKTVGVYGFSHGGLTPQEVIIPDMVFTPKVDSAGGLPVMITNKDDLIEVTGELFGIAIEGKASASDLFLVERKVKINLFVNGKLHTSSNIVTAEKNRKQTLEFSFQGQGEFNAVLMDAQTEQKLDSVTILKSNARDLGGLL